MSALGYVCESSGEAGTVMRGAGCDLFWRRGTEYRGNVSRKEVRESRIVVARKGNGEDGEGFE